MMRLVILLAIAGLLFVMIMRALGNAPPKRPRPSDRDLFEIARPRFEAEGFNLDLYRPVIEETSDSYVVTIVDRRLAHPGPNDGVAVPEPAYEVVVDRATLAIRRENYLG